MPSISALLKVAFYWLLWLLIARRLFQGHSAGHLSALGWSLGAAALTAWFTWVTLHDDKQARRYGEDAEAEDGPASPASRFAGALALGFGAFASFVFGALIPELRGALLSFAVVALVAAVYVLFFGRKSSSSDIDL